MATAINRTDTVKTASGLVMIAAIWLIIAPFALRYTFLAEAAWNDILVGIAVVVLAAWKLGAPAVAAASWVNVALGLWLIIAPFVLGYQAVEAAYWNDVLVGLAIAGLATWSALASPERRRPAGGPPV